MFRNYFIFVTAVTTWNCTGSVAEYTFLYVRYVPQNKKDSFRTVRIAIRYDSTHAPNKSYIKLMSIFEKIRYFSTSKCS
jgi:hypothetical protein